MIWLAQYLCPDRHCVIGMAYDPDNHSREAIEQMLDSVFTVGAVNRWCGLCGSKKLAVEHAATPFRTMDEAEPVLEKEQGKQMATRAAANAVRRWQARNN